jgi:hypothetical protein
MNPNPEKPTKSETMKNEINNQEKKEKRERERERNRNREGA